MDKIIILTPRLNRVGGIANYYKALEGSFSFPVKYLERGYDKNFPKIPLLSSPIRSFKDLINYLLFLFRNKVSLIHINTSLDYGGIFRDGFYYFFRKKTPKIVFFRGWNKDFERKIENSFLIRIWFKRTFLKSNHIIVLSETFKYKLKEWGYNGNISVETTVVDKRLLENVNIEDVLLHRLKKQIVNILFLGRIEKTKGVFLLINAFQKLNEHYKNRVTFTIAGWGRDQTELQKKIQSLGFSVNFPGYIRDEKKKEVLCNADIYILPSYGEGMPNSILEAMAFGLPIITTPVGGIPDVFVNKETGFYIDTFESQEIVEKLKLLIDKPELRYKMGRSNYQRAQKDFMSDMVAKRLEQIYEEVIKKNTNEKV